MTAIGLDSVVTRVEGFSTAQVQDNLMMLDVQQGAYYSLDPIGAEIWNLMEQPTPVRDIVDRLKDRYAVSLEQCMADVLAFLEDMLKNGMIQVQ